MTQSSERKNGCFNRETFQEGHFVQDGWHSVRVADAVSGQYVETILPNMVYVANVNSTDCQHDSKNDRGCDGCKWQKT